MIKYLLSTALLLALYSTSFAQDDLCGSSKNKKIKKIYEKLYDRETTDQERFELLREAMEVDEFCVECFYDYARLAYYDARQNFKSYDKAIEYYKKSIDICPKYRADAYYTLGMIYYDMEERETAIEYMNEFLNFESDVPQAVPSNFNKKVFYLKELMPKIQFWIDWHKNVVDFEPEAVKNVSSSEDEYLPMISPDNEAIYFSRKIELPSGPVKKFIEPLFVANRENEDVDFQSGKKMGPPFSSNDFEGLGGVTISVDNHEMIICGCAYINVDINGDGKVTPQERYKNCDLYSTKFEREYAADGKNYLIKWSPLERLPDGINTQDGWEATPTLSGDGQTLYFAAIRPGMTDIDIFYSVRQEDGNWSTARRVRGLNTNGDDKSPYMHADSRTMYFVSGANKSKEQNNDNYVYDWADKNVGGFDIYYAKQKSDGSFEDPVLMAKPINTEYDEVGLVVSTDGHWAYFATNRLKGAQGMDIFRFPLYEEAKPDKVVLIKGKVNDENGKPDDKAVVEVKKKSTGEKVKTEVGADGKYAMVVNVEEEDDLVVTTKKEGHFPKTELITKEQIKEMHEEKKAVVKVEKTITEQVKPGSLFEIPDILYATASAELNAKSKFVLDQFVDYLKENPSMKVEIQGHTDNEGIAAKNKVLSQDRANGVMEYLVSQGINKSRLTAVGYGQEKPKVPNTTPENKAKNRRTVFKIVEA